MITQVTRDILAWAEANPRELPWKATRDPYRIWISEIMLQQTQVAQGIQYYERFLERFPTVEHLASASEDEVLHMWQGLGYNSRARNLHHAARTIVDEYQGVFPRDYHDIRGLKGVGEYTAAAVASFAFDEPVPVLDSNVIRLLCRFYGITGLITERKTRDQLYHKLDNLIAGADPATFNQAVMDFGALQCTPRNPDCPQCPLADRCAAFQDGTVAMLPVKPLKKARRKRFLHYFILTDDRSVVIQKRTGKDIWEQMYEFPLIETNSDRMPGLAVRQVLVKPFGYRGSHEVRRIDKQEQLLTHQHIICSFYRIEAESTPLRILPGEARFELFENLENFAFPKVIRTFLKAIFQSQTPQGSAHD